MTREEAIEKARQMSLPKEMMEILEVLAPELKDNEDERIRRDICTWLKHKRETCTYPTPKEEILSTWIAYLEKQKEQKPKNILTDDDSLQTAYLKGQTDVLEDPEAYGLQKEQKPVMIQWTGKNLKEVIDFTGKSPRFDEWFKSWEEFENYVHSHDDILKLFCEDGSHYEVPMGAWIVKTPDSYNIPSRFRFIQKPAEWSEEDESFLDSIEEAISSYYDLNHAPQYHYWLEEKLKSLRPSWKPSEEQIHAIIEALKYLPNNKDEWMILNTLVDVLRKQM